MIAAYTIMGIAMSISSAAILAVLAFDLARHGKRPLYKRRLNKVSYPEGFFCEIKRAYRNTENIRSALALMEAKLKEEGRKDALFRVARALDYLENSRYKDYETALSYLSDGLPESDEAIREILTMEAQKQERLPDKQMKGEEK